jgi:glycosyltransferase involved in cell wall biosynthesis
VNQELVIVIPLFNEEAIIERIYDKLNTQALKAVLVENGSTDNTWEKLNYHNRLSKSDYMNIKILDKGIGHAYVKAIEYLIQSNYQGWILLSSADLPFEFSDLQQFYKSKQDPKTIYIGSKWHSDSEVKYNLFRKLFSSCFFILRYFLLKLNVKDTQGTIFLHSSQLKNVLSSCHSRDFFFSTELIFRLHQLGANVVEIPVVYKGEIRKSRVNLFRDGKSILKKIIKLSVDAKIS